MAVSAWVMVTAANIRAASTMFWWRTTTWSRRAASYWINALPEKNSAVAVWSALRRVEFVEPNALTSWKSRVYSREVNRGGGPGRPNCAPLRTMSGVTKPSQGAAIGANAVGVGRHTPVAGGWSKVMAA